MTYAYQPMEDGSDAVHYGAVTSMMEAQILLNMLCEGLAGDLPLPRGSCKVVDSKYNERLATFETKKKHARCIPKGWNPKHH